MRISHGAGDAPPPPLAGALAAWFDRAGVDVVVVDRESTGSGQDPATWAGPGTLWAHLEAQCAPGRRDQLRRLAAWQTAHGAEPVILFGPGTDDAELVAELVALLPDARAVQGDPEPAAAAAAASGNDDDDDGDASDPRVVDLGGLPITTWAGFAPREDGVFRLLAGRGDRVRPLPHLLREIVYLVETHKAGWLLFDDADLGAWPGWLDGFEAALQHLPWGLGWEGMVAGRRLRRAPTR